MPRSRHVRWMGIAALVLVLAVTASVAAAAGRYRSALDDRPERGRHPEVETVVLRFIHVPADSFIDTLHQLAERNHEIREGLEQMPLAVNEPANAVVLIAPPEVADALRRMAEELDQPNEFRVHEREREMEDIECQIELEERKRAMDREQTEFELDMYRRKMELQHSPKPPCPMPCPMGRLGMPGMMGRSPTPPCPCPGKVGPKAPCPPKGRPDDRPCRDPDERCRQEVERIEAEQHKLRRMLGACEGIEEKQLDERRKRREHMREMFQRRLEEGGDDLPPEAREHMTREFRERARAYAELTNREQEQFERKRDELRRRIEELERRKHEIREGHREHPEPHHEKPGYHDRERDREGDRPPHRHPHHPATGAGAATSLFV